MVQIKIQIQSKKKILKKKMKPLMSRKQMTLVERYILLAYKTFSKKAKKSS